MSSKRGVALGALLTLLLAACDFWPRDLEALAKSIGQELSGEATAWLLGGDMVMIAVAGSPAFGYGEAELEAVAEDLAGQAMEAVPAPLEAAVVMFHENDLADDGGALREFVFLVLDGRPVLQADIDDDVTGPLTDAELQAAIDRFDEAWEGPNEGWTPERRDCVLADAKRRAQAAGDPEALDPENVASLEGFSANTWKALDAFGRRLFLTQAITTRALFKCVSE